MRLIDADALKEEICYRYFHFTQRLEISEVFEAIEKAPTIDAVPVIRCEHCKWRDEEDLHSDGRQRCELLDNIRFEPDFFCKYGERKEE